MEITNQTTKQRCVLSFKPAGWFSGGGDLHAVEGFIVDRNKNKLKSVLNNSYRHSFHFRSLLAIVVASDDFQY